VMPTDSPAISSRIGETPHMSPAVGRASAGLRKTIPALPARDVRAAVAHYRKHFGFDVPHETDDFAVLVRDDAVLHLVDALFAELEPHGVLHDISRVGVVATDFGTREFASLDLDGDEIDWSVFPARAGKKDHSSIRSQGRAGRP
jgi:hypothetical protein